jgi:Uma2 family endonuclease
MRDSAQGADMATTARLVTADELLRMPGDGKFFELVRGELRQLSPAYWSHSALEARLVAALVTYVSEHTLGQVTTSDGGYLLASGPDTVRAPDVAFVSAERIPPDGAAKGFFPGGPDLAAEILSPSNTVREIDERIDDFFAAGTRLLWVVHPRKHTVTVYAPNRPPRLLTEHDVLDGEDVVPGFRYELAKLW